MQKIRIGAVVDSLNTNVHLALFHDWVKDQEKVELTVVFVTQSGASPLDASQAGKKKAGYRSRSVAKIAFQGVLESEKFFSKFFSKKKRYLCREHLNRDGLGANTSIPIVQFDAVDGVVPAQRLVAEQLKLDLLVNFSSTVLPRSMLNIARLGTIRIDYTRGRLTADAPVGFWEPYYRTPKTKFSITSSTMENDVEEVILEGSFRTQFSFLLNQAHLYRKSLAQLQQMLLTIASTGALPHSRKNTPDNGRHLTHPDMHESILYLAKLLGRISAKAFRRTLKIKENWGIQFIQSDWHHASLLHATRISPPPGHFWADPFLRSHGGRTYCFIEDYEYATNRAYISALDVSGKNIAYLGPVLKEDFHLSFPFIFEYQGQLYMCPEASESNQIRVYRAISFPMQWELCSVAMDNISAADSMFFEHKGKWWLLTSIDRSGLNDHCSELSLFYANSPLDQQWAPHPQNPIYVDTEGGRNAGLILEHGRIFRAAQNQGFDRYGESLSIYEVVKLDEQTFEEVRVTDFKNGISKNSLGSHHISTTGKITAFDFLTRRFAP